MNRPKKVTQSDVARAAKVSQGIVSSVLSGRSNDSLSVSDSTRRRILSVASDLGYQMRSSARRSSLNEGRPAQVLLVLPPPQPHPGGESSSPVNSSYRGFMGNTVSDIGAQLSTRGIGLSVHQLTDEKGLMQWLVESDFRAVIWHTNAGDGSLLGWVAARYPLVVMNQTGYYIELCDGVFVNQTLNIQIALEHLWECGHRRLGYFGQVPNSPMFTERLAAYRGFVQEKGVRNYDVFQSIPDEQNRPAEDKVQRILDVWESLGEDAPTGMVMGDVFALRLLDAAKMRGVQVPQDLSIVGIDNVDACDFVTPKLTSMEQCFSSLCEAVVERLMGRMKNRESPAHYTTIAPHLVERSSVRKFSSELVATDMVTG